MSRVPSHSPEQLRQKGNFARAQNCLFAKERTNVKIYQWADVALYYTLLCDLFKASFSMIFLIKAGDNGKFGIRLENLIWGSVTLG
jgi:hypothetical protein